MTADPGSAESGLVVAAPLSVEAFAVRRGLPGDLVLRTGMGPTRSARAFPRLAARRPAALAVAGVAGALTDQLSPGDLVVATEIRWAGGTLPCPSAPLLAAALRRLGLTVHTGPIAGVDHVVHGAERAELAAGGALAVDMESAALAPAAGDAPFAVVRAIVDTPSRPLVRPATVTGGLAALSVLGRIGPALLAWAAAVGEREVLLASPRSFCAGVDRAIEIVERLLDSRPGPVYVRKQIVHNATVVADLERRGAVFVDELDEVPDEATLVFSAHGVAPSVRSVAQTKRLDVVDATCPLVGKVHHEARRYARQGNTILFIGHAGHEETEGTLGEEPEHTILVQDESEVDDLRVPDPERVSYLMQTTLAVEEAEGIVRALRAKFPALTGPNSDDICYATTNRQRAVVSVAKDVDLFLVVGSANSSNSRRLVEVARREGVDAFLVDDVSQVELDWLSRARRIGVSAGASAPHALVDELVTAIGGLGRLDIAERSTTTETIRFTLPKEVRQ
ncbi:MAG TPA: 4-hydroxy-3-methylbut-2-enyl diphosphate reductase [Pseudonocardiaceae bacterium]|jgi:4-hydroxy-3-methylbut-2-enyl diphosphate reductase|nr:4-hydroxy-3-methylbut-2-enyl diphosphate reductase [Pseudonocardiaceae bacterium]